MDRPSDKASSNLEPPGDNRRNVSGPSLRMLTPSPSNQTLASQVSNDTREGLDQLAPVSSAQSRMSTARSDVNAPSRPPSAYRTSSRMPSIRLRRNSNSSILSQANSIASENIATEDGSPAAPSLARFGRPRSMSNPNTGSVLGDADARHSRRVPQGGLPRLTEEGSRPTMEELGVHGGRLSPTASLPEAPNDRSSSIEVENEPTQRRRRGMSLRFWPRRSEEGGEPAESSRHSRQADEYDEQLVDYLDTVDPEIQALSTLTNIQNSLFVPDLGKFVNRRPAYTLTQEDRPVSRPPTAEPPAEPPIPEIAEQEAALEMGPIQAQGSRIRRTDTITSRLTDSHYAALPHGTSLEGWTDAEKMELDDHVRHMLHSRRSKFKRSMKGFGQYVRRPLGFCVTLYAVLITLFGLAWVLFSIGWIYVGSKQRYTIHIIDSVMVALFAIVGDGMIPFRLMDSYHLIFVVYYSRIMGKAKQKKLSHATEHCESETANNTTNGATNGTTNDHLEVPTIDLEAAEEKFDTQDLYPLNEKQRAKFLHHQGKLAKSHSFYKPEETLTHCSFPLGYLIAVVVLLDCHSCLQISLAATTWGIDYHTRNMAITTVILCVSITSNITAGLVITVGDRKTRKKDVLKLMDRQELTSDAMKQVEKNRRKQTEQENSDEQDLQHQSSSNSGSSLFRKLRKS